MWQVASFWFAVGQVGDSEAPSRRRRTVIWSWFLSTSHNVHLTTEMVLIRLWRQPKDSSASGGRRGCPPAGQIPDSLLRRWEPESQSGSAWCTLTEHLLLLQTGARVIVSGRSLPGCVWHAYLSLWRRRSRKLRSHISPPKYSSSIFCRVLSFLLRHRSCKTPTRHRGSSHLRKTKSSHGKCHRRPRSQPFHKS